MERNLRNDQSGCSVTISQTGLRYRAQQPRRVYLFRTISHNDRTVCYRTGNVLCRLRQYFSSVFRQTVNHYGRILSGKGHTSYSHVGVYPIRHCSYLSGIYHDYIERNGIASSIIGGWKFIDERLVKEYEDEQRTKYKIVLKKEKEKLLKKEIEIKEKSRQALR